MHINKLVVFFVSIFLSIDALAAEFEYKGEKIRSSISSNTVQCDGYEIKIEVEKFPFEYESYVPNIFKISGFYGSNAIVSRKAYLVKNKITLISEANKLDGIKDFLVENRTYLPLKAMCKGNDFVILYWSGGNCKSCEVFVEFSVDRSGFGNPKLISKEMVRDKYD